MDLKKLTDKELVMLHASGGARLAYRNKHGLDDNSLPFEDVKGELLRRLLVAQTKCEAWKYLKCGDCGYWIYKEIDKNPPRETRLAGNPEPWNPDLCDIQHGCRLGHNEPFAPGPHDSACPACIPFNESIIAERMQEHEEETADNETDI